MKTGDGDQSEELQPTTAGSAATVSAAPTTPSAGDVSPSKPLTTEEVCRLPTLSLGDDVVEVAPTVPVSQTVVRGVSTLGHGASFGDNSTEAQLVEAREWSTGGSIHGLYQ